MLLAALVLSAISLASCVDVPLPAECDNPLFSDAPVNTIAFLDVDCNGTEPSVVVKLDPHQSNAASRAGVYVEAVCTWNHTESQSSEIYWVQVSLGQWGNTIVENVTNGANCTFAGCLLTNNDYFLLESRHCVYNRDECALGEDDCHENATCVNTIDGYECHCLPTFTGSGRNCTENPLPTSTPNVLPTTIPPTATLNVLPTTTPNVLPTTTPGPEEPTDSAEFSYGLLSLLVLIPVTLVCVVALAITICCYSRLKQRYVEVSLLGKVDPSCMLVDPKTVVRRASAVSISSEFDKLTFTSSVWWEEKRTRYRTSQSLLEIQQLNYQLKSTSSSAEEDARPAKTQSSSLPNIRDSFMMDSPPKNDPTPNNDVFVSSGTQLSSVFYRDPMTAEYMTQPSSSLLADNTVVDWCLEDVASVTSDSNLQSSTTEHGTSLGPTHQSDSHTQPLTCDPAHSPTDCLSMAAVMDRVAPTDSTKLGSPVTDTTAETRLADSLILEQLDDKCDEEEEDGEYFIAVNLSDVDDSLGVDSVNPNNVRKGVQYYDASIFSQISSCDGYLDSEEGKHLKYVPVDLTVHSQLQQEVTDHP